MSTTINKAAKTKNKKVSGVKKNITIPKEQIEIELADGALGDSEYEIKERLTRFWTKFYKKKGYKNFEIVFA